MDSGTAISSLILKEFARSIIIRAVAESDFKKIRNRNRNFRNSPDNNAVVFLIKIFLENKNRQINQWNFECGNNL